ncbi:hypothetical protein EJD97_015467 [Solanum chilense]|uniref:Transcription factor n=1 Tax=Solanum chilense TaxID=4083 RepID=A0A6N2B6S7_SOLCI|nr:hypothetical protein EJD97_015467 [Solanum chilense]
MDELMVSSSSSSSSFFIPSLLSQTSSNLQQKLQNILKIQTDSWSYAIFWQTTNDDDDGHLFLAWGDGHFHGTKSKTGVQSSQQSTERKNVIKGIQALICENGDEKVNNDDDEVTDAEWFYVMSLAQSFSIGDGVPGKAFSTGSIIWLTGSQNLQFHTCKRAKEAHLHGIQTFVCIPTSNGVIEMGSNQLIKENWVLIQQVKSIFNNSIPHIYIVNCLQQNTNINPKTEELVSVSAECNDSDSDCQVLVEKPVEKKAPKKRGRKPGATRETPLNHVEAEETEEGELTRKSKKLKIECTDSFTIDNHSTATTTTTTTNSVDQIRHNSSSAASFGVQNNLKVEIEVKILGPDAMVRVQSENVNYPSTRLMRALQDLELHVHHASISSVNDIMLQDIVVKVPIGLSTEDRLKNALIRSIEQQ